MLPSIIDPHNTPGAADYIDPHSTPGQGLTSLADHQGGYDIHDPVAWYTWRSIHVYMQLGDLVEKTPFNAQHLYVLLATFRGTH